MGRDTTEKGKEENLAVTFCLSFPTSPAFAGTAFRATAQKGVQCV